MVDYSTLTELELYRDAQTGEFIARDPSDGIEYAVPFEELSVGSVNAENMQSTTINNLKRKRIVDNFARRSLNPSGASYWNPTGSASNPTINRGGGTPYPFSVEMDWNGVNQGIENGSDLSNIPKIGDVLAVQAYTSSFDSETDFRVQFGDDADNFYRVRFGTRIGGFRLIERASGTTSVLYSDTSPTPSDATNYLLMIETDGDDVRGGVYEQNGTNITQVSDSGWITSGAVDTGGSHINLSCSAASGPSGTFQYSLPRTLGVLE